MIKKIEINYINYIYIRSIMQRHLIKSPEIYNLRKEIFLIKDHLYSDPNADIFRCTKRIIACNTAIEKLIDELEKR